MPITETGELLGFYPSDEKVFRRLFPDEQPPDANKRTLLKMNDQIKELNGLVDRLARELHSLRRQTELDSKEISLLKESVSKQEMTITTQRATIGKMRKRLAVYEEQDEPEPPREIKISGFAKRLRERHVL